MIWPAPCREKYIDEAVGIWFILSENSDGTVSVCDGDRDIAIQVPRELAEKLCSMQREFRENLYAVLRSPL